MFSLFSNKTLSEAQKELAAQGKTDHLHYCYRCYECGNLITKIDILEARIAGRLNLCPCGSKMIRITNAKIWEELFLPRCWKIIYAIHNKRLAPPPPPPTPEEMIEARKLAARAQAAFERQMREALK